MGSWGPGPFDNDTAGDLVAQLLQPCRMVAEESTPDKQARSLYAEARVGIQVRLLADGTDILGGPPLQGCLDALVRMRGDELWLASWRRPAEILAALNKEIRAVRRAMRRKPRRSPRVLIVRRRRKKTRKA